MKRILALIIMLAMTVALSACGKAKEEEVIELRVFAAASMTETLTELGDRFTAENPDVKLVFNFDSSGTLEMQIAYGAECDVFIPAGQKQMNQLDITADPVVNTEKLDFVLEGSRFDLLENKVTLCLADNSNKEITSFDELAELLEKGEVFLAIGNADVPVGQYTQKILAYYGLSEEALAQKGCITYGTNVKEVTMQVSEGAVDCGIIYQTDASSAGLYVVDTASSEMCGRVIYPAAVLNISKHQDAAQRFLDFLRTDEADSIFSAVGFTPLS